MARTADSVLVCPTRKPPPRSLIPSDAAGVLETTSAADADDDFSDEALARPPPGCSARQRHIGRWLQHRARFSKSLLAIFYALKLRAWVGLLVRTDGHGARRIAAAECAIDMTARPDHSLCGAQLHASGGAFIYARSVKISTHV